MELEWQAPNRSARAIVTEVHEKYNSMPLCGNLYLRPKEPLSTLLHKPNFNLLSLTSIPSNELLGLPRDI